MLEISFFDVQILTLITFLKRHLLSFSDLLNWIEKGWSFLEKNLFVSKKSWKINFDIEISFFWKTCVQILKLLTFFKSHLRFVSGFLNGVEKGCFFFLLKKTLFVLKKSWEINFGIEISFFAVQILTLTTFFQNSSNFFSGLLNGVDQKSKEKNENWK